MPLLQFPTERIVGVLAWSTQEIGDGPVLATGSVQVPAQVEVNLEIQSLQGSERAGDDAWRLIPAGKPVDLAFVRELPPDGIESVSVVSADEASFDALAHLAPGLRRLYLGWTAYSDAVLATVAKLTGLSYLQTFGNNFTDRGVQQLATLVNLEYLYLEEETLTLAAFDFVERLPRLTSLGLQDVPLSQHDIEQLRSRLPRVDVG
jgi:hypothetical protein